jgi:hypothetical protein
MSPARNQLVQEGNTKNDQHDLHRCHPDLQDGGAPAERAACRSAAIPRR